MKTLIAIVVLLFLATIAALVALGAVSRSGAAGGLVDGRLTPCPGTPNCVGSEFPVDPVKTIEPIAFSSGDPALVKNRLKQIVQEMGGNIEAETRDYLAATFSSPIFGFVDDLEIRIDDRRKLVHLRSASRVGYGDGGVNRDRVERLKQLFR